MKIYLCIKGTFSLYATQSHSVWIFVCVCSYIFFLLPLSLSSENSFLISLFGFALYFVVVRLLSLSVPFYKCLPCSQMLEKHRHFSAALLFNSKAVVLWALQPHSLTYWERKQSKIYPINNASDTHQNSERIYRQFETRFGNFIDTNQLVTELRAFPFWSDTKWKLCTKKGKEKRKKKKKGETKCMQKKRFFT